MQAEMLESFCADIEKILKRTKFKFELSKRIDQNK